MKHEIQREEQKKFQSYRKILAFYDETPLVGVITAKEVGRLVYQKVLLRV